MSISSPERSLFVLEEAGPLLLDHNLDRFELGQDCLEEPLVIEAGARLALGPDTSCPLFRGLKTTVDLHEFKSWIGVPNALIESGKCQPPAALPRIRPRQLERAKESLSVEDLADLKRARDYFVFGRSDLVE